MTNMLEYVIIIIIVLSGLAFKLFADNKKLKGNPDRKKLMAPKLIAAGLAILIFFIWMAISLI